jgi:hypothetical protein
VNDHHPLRLEAVKRLLLSEGIDKPGLAERLLDASYADRLGTQNGRSKLFPSHVADIRNRVAAGEAMRAVARRYEISDRQVKRIVGGENWTRTRRVTTTTTRGIPST